jgi:hypothetical protein
MEPAATGGTARLNSRQRASKARITAIRWKAVRRKEASREAGDDSANGEIIDNEKKRYHR